MMSKKRVLFMSIYDWANSGYKMCEAVNRNSDKYHCDYFAVYSHPFGYDRGGRFLFDHADTKNEKIVADTLSKLQEAVEACDMLHFKEDRGILEEIGGVRIPLDKPIMITFCGSVFRSMDQKVYEDFKNHAKKLTVTTPNLNEGRDTVMDILPFAVDGQKYSPIARSQDCIILGHMPSNPNSKGTAEIHPVLQKVADRHPGKVFMLTFNNVPFYYGLEFKRIMHVYVDQMRHGAYGNSAVEAMAFGCATLAKSDYGCPGILDVQNAEALEAELEHLVTDPGYLQSWQQRCYDWFISYHDYHSVALRVEKYYNEVLGIAND